MSKFKVGDKVRRVSNGTESWPIGHETTVLEMYYDGFFALDAYNKNEYASSDWFELVEPKAETKGPVIYETVRKPKILPGVYGDVTIDVVATELATTVSVGLTQVWYTADQLAKVIETLTTIHKAMEEGA